MAIACAAAAPPQTATMGTPFMDVMRDGSMMFGYRSSSCVMEGREREEWGGGRGRQRSDRRTNSDRSAIDRAGSFLRPIDRPIRERSRTEVFPLPTFFQSVIPVKRSSPTTAMVRAWVVERWRCGGVRCERGAMCCDAVQWPAFRKSYNNDNL